MAEHVFTIRLYPKLDKAKKDGTVPIYAKIWLDKQKTEISTGRSIDPIFWNDTSQKVIKADNADTLNRFLSTLIGKIDNAYSQLYIAGEIITLEAIKTLVLGKAIKKEKGLIEVMEEHNKHFLSLVGTEYSMGSYKNYKSTLKFLKEFIPLQFKRSDIPLLQVNYNFLQGYYAFLLTSKTCTTNGANKQIQRIKKVVNYAVKHEYISTNPTATFALRNKPFTKSFLTIDEVNRLAALELQRPILKMVRDVFIFQVYTGLAYSDMKGLKPLHIIRRKEGEYWIKKDRVKSKISFTVPILPPAQRLLDEYLAKGGEFIFPVVTNQQMNQNLKVIQELASISKSLTTHVARHTFATTITLSNKVPIETVAKMMGHTKLSTTQVYAKVLDAKIWDDMTHLRDKLGDKE